MGSQNCARILSLSQYGFGIYLDIYLAYIFSYELFKIDILNQVLHSRDREHLIIKVFSYQSCFLYLVLVKKIY